MHDARRGRHDPLDVAAVRIEQRAAGDEAADVGLAHCLLPPVDDGLPVLAGIAAQQQDGHGGRRGHLGHARSRRDLEPRVGTARAEPRCDRDDANELLVAGVEVGAALGVGEIGKRLDHAQQALVRQRRRDRAAHLDRARDARVGELDAQQQLAAVESGGGDVVGVVRRHPVVELPARALDAAAVDRAEGQPAVERAQPRELLEDVGAGHDAIDAGHRQAAQQVGQQRAPIGHGERVVSDREHAPGGVVGRENHEVAVVAGDAATRPVGECASQRLGVEDPRIAQGGVGRQGENVGARAGRAGCAAGATRVTRVTRAVDHQMLPSMSASTWPIVGMASAQVSWVAT